MSELKRSLRMVRNYVRHAEDQIVDALKELTFLNTLGPPVAMNWVENRLDSCLCELHSILALLDQEPID